MPRFLGEFPTWPEVEEELKKRQADPATIATVRTKYWADYASTEEIKALPPIHVEAARSRFFQQPVTPTEPNLTLMEKAAALISPPGPPPAAPVVIPPPVAPPVEPTTALGRIKATQRGRPSIMAAGGAAADELARVISEKQAGMSPTASDIVGIIPKILARAGQAAALYPAAADALVEKVKMAAADVLGLGVQPHPPGWEPGLLPATPATEGPGRFAHEKFIAAKGKMPAKTGAGRVADLVTETGAGLAEVLAPLLVGGGVLRPAAALAPGVTAGLGPAMAAEITAARAAAAGLAADMAGGGAATAAQALAEGRPVTLAEVGQGAAAMGGIGVGGRWGAKVGIELAQALDRKGLERAAQILIETGSKVKATAVLKKALIAGGVGKEALEHAGAAIPIYVSTLEQTKTAKTPNGDPTQAFATTVALVAAGAISRRVTGPTLMEQGRARLSPEDAVAAARQVQEARAARPKGIEPETITVEAKAAEVPPQPPQRPPTGPPQAPQQPPTPPQAARGIVTPPEAPKPGPAPATGAAPVPIADRPIRVMTKPYAESELNVRREIVPSQWRLGTTDENGWTTIRGTNSDGDAVSVVVRFADQAPKGAPLTVPAMLRDLLQPAKPVPQPEMSPETHDTTPDITRPGFVPGDATGIGGPPGERWETDPGAMPGEPYFGLDIPKDSGIDDSKAFITEREIEGKGAVWEAWLSDGRGGQFTSVEDAAKWAEEQVDAGTIRTRQGQRVPEAAQEGPQPQGGAQEGQGDRGADMEQAPPREPEPVVEGGKGPVQEVGKQPWEMTRDEWNGATRFYRSGKTKNAQLPTGQRVILTNESTAGNFLEQSGPFLDTLRRQAVEAAVRQGKSVPPEVLAELGLPVQEVAKQPWEMTREEWIVSPQAGAIATQFNVPKKKAPGFLVGYHKSQVELASKRGEPVPPEILADYPDLKPVEKVGTPAQVPTVPPARVILKTARHLGPVEVLDNSNPDTVQVKLPSGSRVTVPRKNTQPTTEIPGAPGIVVKSLVTGQEERLPIEERPADQTGFKFEAIGVPGGVVVGGERAKPTGEGGALFGTPESFSGWTRKQMLAAIHQRGIKLGGLKDRSDDDLRILLARVVREARGIERPPDHVVRALQAPMRVVSDSVITKTKEQAKETIREAIADGAVTRDTPVRLTDVGELNDLVKSGVLSEEKSAQIVVGEKGEALPIMGYGHGISAAVIMPEGYSRKAAGLEHAQPNEVKIDPKAPVEEMRFIVDGYKRLLTYAELGELIRTGKLAALEQAAPLRGEKPEVILKGGETLPGEPAIVPGPEVGAPKATGGEPGGLHPAAGELGIQGGGAAVGAERPAVPATPVPRAEEVIPPEAPAFKVSSVRATKKVIQIAPNTIGNEYYITFQDDRLSQTAVGRSRKEAIQKAIEQRTQDERAISRELATIKVPASAATTQTPAADAARRVAEELVTLTELTPRKLKEIGDVAWGGTQAQGTYTSKDLSDAMELGVNLYLRQQGEGKADPTVPTAQGAARRIALLEHLTDLLPTQTRRTDEMLTYQQFSTPPAYAYLVNWVANIKPEDTVLEPSAGNGAIAVFAMNAPTQGVIANEIAPNRVDNLRTLGVDRVFTENAEQLNNLLPADVQPTVVVMNPPFSQTAGRMGEKREIMAGAHHIEQALKRLVPGGRLVAIAGRGMTMDAQTYRAWWTRIQKEYNVRANVGVPGNVFAKYGTAFATRILVIDKTGPTAGIVQVGNLDTLQQGTDLLSEVRNDRRSPNLEQKPPQPGGGALPQEGGGAPVTVLPLEPVTGNLGAGEPERVAGAGVQVPGRAPRAGTTNAELVAGEGGGPPGEPGLGPVVGEGGTGNLSADRGIEPAGGGGLPHREPPQQPEQVAGNVEVADQGTARKSGALDENVIFEPYTPQRLLIPGAQPHPGALVESAAMASVLPPKPTYSPNLPKDVVAKGLLSLPQLEAVVYAGQAHEEMLPAVEGETAYRRGFMVGDGTGVGKGREISGIIMDNMRRGRKKAIWVTATRTLVEDARRDWSDIGGEPRLIMDFGKVKAGSEIASTHGIMVATYDTIKSGTEFPGGPKKKKAPPLEGQAPEKQKASRLDQLVKWVGPDFDGVLVFDEAHNMGNAIEIKGTRGKKQPAAKALAGVELQRRLPSARVVYTSATAATEVSNLSYADRLGLWGRGTAFPTKHKFIGDIGAGRLAAMEMVALNSKAMGAYVARSLSFNDGTPEGTVEVGRITHPLTEGQREIYNELATAWQVVLQNFNKALEIVAGAENRRGEIKVNKEARKNAMSQFWGTQQRFFNQVLTAMQMPSIVADMEKELEAGHSCVVQIINTNEAEQERQIAKTESLEDLEELDLTPREALMQMVEHAFPVNQQEQYTDDSGNVLWRLVTDSKGNPVENSEAVEMRDRLLDHLASIRVPDGPLEHLFNRFGADNVAEVTGRTRRIVRKTMPDGGQKTIVERRSSHANTAETDAFQEGKKRILVFSAAGGTGRSYHADRTAANQQRRVHYLAQPGWRADTAVQGLGRTHRSNQVSAPIVKLTETDIKGHKRFISSIARRLDQLGALTKGQRQTGSTGIFSAADNLESAEARDALETLLTDIHRGDVEGITNAEFESSTGLKLTTEDGNLKEQLPPITQFLNRLLALKVDDQNRLFDAFAERLQQKVDQAIAAGTLDLGMETVRADSITKKSEQTVYTDPRSGAKTKYIQLEVKNKTKVITWEAVNRGTGLGGAKPEFFVKTSHGKLYAAAKGGTKTRSDGYVMRQYRLADQRSFHYVDTDSIDYDSRNRYTKIDGPAEAETAWNEAVAELPQFTSEDRHLLTGALLPVWDRLPTSMTKVQRMVTDEGERFLGRVIPPGQIGTVLEQLGAGAPESEIKITPDEAMNKIADGKITVKLANGWTVKRAIVGGEPRVEVVGPDFQADNELKRDGVFTERIAYAKRYFIPTGAQGPETFRRITEYRPVAEVVHRSQVETPAAKAKRAVPAPAALVSTLSQAIADTEATLKKTNLNASERQALEEKQTKRKALLEDAKTQASDEEVGKKLSERMLEQRRGAPEKGTPTRPPETHPTRGRRWYRIIKGDPKSATIEWVEGIPVKIAGISGADIFAYQNAKEFWVISEATAGMTFGLPSKTLNNAVSRAKGYLQELHIDNDKFHEVLARAPKLPTLYKDEEGPEELHAASDPFAALLQSLFGARERPDAVAVESKFPEVEKRWLAAKGLPTASLRMKMRKAVADLRRAWQESIPGINPHENPTMAVAQDILRQYNAVPSLAKAVAHDILWNVTHDLGPKREDLLTRVLALRDIVRNVENGTDTEESVLSFGYENVDQAREDLAKYEDILALPENAPIHAALERAIAQRQAIVQKLVDLELLPEEALNNAGAYYHRQVLSHYQPEKTKFVGTGSGDVRLHKKGFQRRRVGGEHDFNTRYTEAEFEWLSQAVAQIATKETLDKLDRALNVADRLRQEARMHNSVELFGGLDNYQRVQYLRSIPRDEISDEQIAELRELDVLAPFRQRIAIAMSQLRGMIEEGQVEVPARYGKVADQLAAEGDTDGFWPFLSWLAEQNDNPGSGPARGVFKAISDREAFTRQRLGDNYLTWGYQGQRIDQRLVPEGYAFWQPEKGNHFFGALTIPEKVLARVLEGTSSISAEDLKRVLVIGGVKRQWVIPASLAKALDSYRDHDESPVERAAVAAESSWKQWTLLNPARALRYNLNNQSGDMDIAIAIDPGIVTHEYLKAARDLWGYQVTHRVSATLRDEMQEAIKRGVIESGLTVAEIQDINKVGAFRLLTSRNPNLVQGAIERYWGGVKTFTTWRENGLRLGAYRRALKRLRAGDRLYWASPRDEMDALYDAVAKGTRTLEDVAAKLAREAIGDYGDVSVAGQYLRSHLAPFWSWQEINAPRYVRLLKNLAHERTAGGEKPGRGAAERVAAVAGKRGAMWLAGRWFRLAILSNLLFAMVYLWNRTMFPEDDKLLNRNRDKLSLILGHRADGSIQYVRFEGALSDALDWFNLGNWPHEIESLAAGRKTWKDIAADAVKGPAERIVSAWEPFSKTVFELALGRRVGMKVFEPGASFEPRGIPIRDRAQHVARVFSVAQLYDLVTGKPKRQGVAANVVDAFFTYGTDPGEAAYYLIRDQAGRWNDTHGKESAGGSDPTNRQNALYYYKKALQWGDEKAAKKWLAEYTERGGTGPGMMSSIRLSAPMGTINKSQRLAFLASLGPEDKETLRIANEWYERWAATLPR